MRIYWSSVSPLITVHRVHDVAHGAYAYSLCMFIYYWINISSLFAYNKLHYKTWQLQRIIIIRFIRNNCIGIPAISMHHYSFQTVISYYRRARSRDCNTDDKRFCVGNRKHDIVRIVEHRDFLFVLFNFHPYTCHRKNYYSSNKVHAREVVVITATHFTFFTSDASGLFIKSHFSGSILFLFLFHFSFLTPMAFTSWWSIVRSVTLFHSIHFHFAGVRRHYAQVSLRQNVCTTYDTRMLVKINETVYSIWSLNAIYLGNETHCAIMKNPTTTRTKRIFYSFVEIDVLFLFESVIIPGTERARGLVLFLEIIPRWVFLVRRMSWYIMTSRFRLYSWVRQKNRFECRTSKNQNW